MPSLSEGIKGRISHTGRQPHPWPVSHQEQPKPLCSNIRMLQREKPTLLAKWFLHGEGFCSFHSPESWEFTVQLSGSCVMTRTREKTDPLTAHKVYHGCCPSLEHGLTRRCVSMAWPGFVRQQHLAAIVKDLVPTAQGLGERQSKSLPQELTICVVPGPI